MPTSITLRATKGSALTHNEVDDNFSNLKTTADAALPTASLGTNVATALAVNVGSAGAFVTFNGAGGTPSSLTLTNATGLPAAGVVGTAAILGANTFTATQTVNPEANTSAIVVSGGSITGSGTTVPGITVAGTLNTSGTVVGAVLYGNITNTASNAASTLLEMQVSGVRRLAVRAADGFLVNSAGLFGFQKVGGTKPTVVIDGTSDTGPIVSRSGGGYSWCQYADDAANTPDTKLSRNAAGVVEVNSGTAGTYRDLIARSLFVAPSSANGQKLGLTELTELTTIAAAATTDTTIQMPAGAIVVAVSVRVTTAIPDATSFDVGDSGSANRFNTASVGVAANSTDAGTKAGAYYNASALSVRLTMNGTPPAANTGRVRVTIFYFLSTPPTS